MSQFLSLRCYYSSSLYPIQIGKASHRPRGEWINTYIKYTMSEEIYDYICCPNTKRVIRDKFKYRMCSISKEVSHCFPGCVINVQDYYEANKHSYWRIPAYCTHLDCRNYKLLANFSNPRVFEVFVDIVNKFPMLSR